MTVTSALAPQSAACSSFLAHWRGMLERRPGHSPHRRDIDPTQLRAALRSVWLYERTETGEYQAQLLGEAVKDAWRSTKRAPTLQDLVPGAWREVQRRFDYTLDQNVLVHGVSTTASKTWLCVERLYAPMIGRDGGRSVIFGATAYDAARIKDDAPPPLSQTLFMYDPVTLEPIGPLPDSLLSL